MKIKIKRYETEQGPLYGLVVSKETLATLVAAFATTSHDRRRAWLEEAFGVRGAFLPKVDPENSIHADYQEMWEFLRNDLKK